MFYSLPSQYVIHIYLLWPLSEKITFKLYFKILENEHWLESWDSSIFCLRQQLTDSVHWGKMSHCDYVLSSVKRAKWDEIITHASHSYSIKDMLENFSSLIYLHTQTYSYIDILICYMNLITTFNALILQHN